VNAKDTRQSQKARLSTWAGQQNLIKKTASWKGGFQVAAAALYATATLFAISESIVANTSPAGKTQAVTQELTQKACDQTHNANPNFLNSTGFKLFAVASGLVSLGANFWRFDDKQRDKVNEGLKTQGQRIFQRHDDRTLLRRRSHRDRHRDNCRGVQRPWESESLRS